MPSRDRSGWAALPDRFLPVGPVLIYSRRQLLSNAVIKRIAVAVATSREGHRTLRSDREGREPTIPKKGGQSLSVLIKV
jgi:hypothetical protein